MTQPFIRGQLNVYKKRTYENKTRATKPVNHFNNFSVGWENIERNLRFTKKEDSYRNLRQTVKIVMFG